MQLGVVILIRINVCSFKGGALVTLEKSGVRDWDEFGTAVPDSSEKEKKEAKVGGRAAVTLNTSTQEWALGEDIGMPSERELGEGRKSANRLKVSA